MDVLEGKEANSSIRGRELMPMAWGCHIDIEQGIIKVGRKKASKWLEIFCLEWGRK